MRRTVVSCLGLILLLCGSTALGAVVLNFDQSGTDLTITAEQADQSEQYWQLVIDENRGVISEFYDLTSTAGTNFNFASPYVSGAGLFVPFDPNMRSGRYTYTAGTKVDGQTSYVYTLFWDAGDIEHTTTVTIDIPDDSGTTIDSQTSSYYVTAATVAQKGTPELWLNAASETEMNAIYSATLQDDISIDGTLWLDVEVADSTQTATLGLTVGRSFTLVAEDYTDGQLDYDDAWGLTFSSTYRARGGLEGGIYDGWASKPPANTTCVTNVRLDINIVASSNDAPVANAGTDQLVHDTDASGDEAVTLDGTGSTDSDGTISSYVWEENASQIATGSAPSVTLATGSHAITLTVTDDDSDSDSDTVNVEVNAGPTASAGADQSVIDADNDGYHTITLDGSASTDDGSIVSYVWEENAAQIATGASPAVSFAIGSYTVTLTVTDDDGATATDTVDITVQPWASLDFTQNGTNLEIVAQTTDTTQQFWKLVLDENRGVITEFYDLTSTAGTSFNFVSPYASGAGLFVPFHPDIRKSLYAYTAGAKVDGQSTYVYTLFRDEGDIEHTTTVTINCADALGTVINGQTSSYYVTAAPAAQKGMPQMNLNAASETEMNDLYSSTLQDDISVDGTLWAEIVVDNSTQATTLGLTPGRSFTLTAEDYTDGGLDYDTAWGMAFNTAYRVQAGLEGGIYDGYASKPPADYTCVTNVTMDINIAATLNAAPIANAGTDQLVHDADSNGESVILDGTASTDADGSITSYVWEENASQIATGSSPSVTLTDGTHTITLTVTDDFGASDSDTVSVEVNPAPTAAAGTDINVTDTDDNGSESVTLDGSASTDDGSIASYVWEENASQIATGATATTALTIGVHTITLTVTDDNGATDTDSLTATINAAPNEDPVANAGTDITVYDNDQTGNESVTLDGSASADSDGSIISWVWTANSTQIASGETASATIANGTTAVTLTVTDDDGATDTDTVTVTVIAVDPTVLNFTQNGTNLEILAEKEDQTVQYWKMVIDETRGVITEFYDLTSTAGTSFNFAGPYASGYGLWAPFDTYIRNGTYTYTAGAKVDGQTTYVYTIKDNFGTNDVNYHETTVTIGVPTPDGTRFSAVTEHNFTEASAVTVKGFPYLALNCATETEMNQIYSDTVQDDLAVDGTLWAEVAVADSTQTATLGLTVGRTFKMLALNYTTGGSVGYGDANALVWNASYRAQSNLEGGIYDNYASKPPAGSNFNTYTQLLINITGTGYVANAAPTANAGSDQSIIDTDNGGSESVTLDGSASTDSDGGVVTYAWSEGQTSLGIGSSITTTMAVGTHTVTLTVTDDLGATGTDTTVVTVLPRDPKTYYVDQSHASASDSNAGTSENAPLATIGAGTAKALSGDTVIVKEGIYRERVSISANGLSGSPITLKANTGDRVVIAGSAELTGWTQYQSSNIYYVDIDWEPTRLYEDDSEMTEARSPNTGWWSVGGGTSTTVVDTVNLTQTDSSYWVGATIFFREVAPVTTPERAITGFDPATDTLTVDDLGIIPDGGKDRYFIYGKLNLLDTAGEWCWEDNGDGTYRVYVWPSDSGAPSGHLIEASKLNGYLVSTTGYYKTFDGFEIRHGYKTPGQADSYLIGSESASGDVTVSNCIIHKTDYFGLYWRSSDGNTLKNSIVNDCEYGIVISYADNNVIEECEIAYNRIDGVRVTHTSDGNTIQRCYIHSHYLWSHPDCTQMFADQYNTVSNVTWQDNVIMNGGQLMHTQQVDGLFLYNNVFLGSRDGMIYLEQDFLSDGVPIYKNTEDVIQDHNTFAFAGESMNVSKNHTGRDFTNNIYFKGRNGPISAGFDDQMPNIYGDAQGYYADYNIYFHGPSITDKVISWNNVWNYWADYLTASSQDANGYYQDPKLTNAPVYICKSDKDDMPFFTSTKIYLDATNGGTWNVGDYIELDCDGVARTIQTTGTDSKGLYITFSPARTERYLNNVLLLNWKTNSNFAYDFTLQSTSPGYGADSTGGDIGSDLNIGEYRSGNLDGVSGRDIPAYPPTN